MKKYRHVILIGVDGMGAFNKVADTPNMDRIFENGAVSYEALSLAPTISAENWGGMLLGADPVVHGLTNSIVDRNEYTNEALPSVFTRIRKVMGDDVYLTSCSNWNPINHGIIEHNINVTLQTADNDSELMPKILEEVKKKPTFFFIQFDNVDGAGHGHGYGTEGHIKQIETTDGYIGEIYDAYVNEGIIDDTLFLVIADHGGYDHGHGGFSDGEKYVFLGASGKGVKKGNLGFAQTKDISAIVLAALGIDLPDYDELGFSSQVPEGMFEDYDAVHVNLQPREYTGPAKQYIAPGDEKGIFSYIDRNKLACGFMFEGSTDDFSGKVETKEAGHVKYYNIGVVGECGEPGENGHIETSPVSLKDGVTVAVWIKKDKAHHDSVVVCSTNVRDENTKGFNVVETIQQAEFKICTGKEDHGYAMAFPADMESGWVHFAASFDNKTCEVKFFSNFKCLSTLKAEEYFKGIDLTAPVFIGEDLSGKHNSVKRHTNTLIDDLLIFNQPLTEEEISRLGEYYK